MSKEPDTNLTPANTGAEKIPPGATRKAFDREEMPGGGPPGSGGGSRHAAGDDNDQWDTGIVEDEAPADPLETEAFSGPTGGAVGGTPANKRAVGGENEQ